LYNFEILKLSSNYDILLELKTLKKEIIMSCVLSWPKNLKVTKSKHKLTQNIANNLKKEMETEGERESERKRG